MWNFFNFFRRNQINIPTMRDILSVPRVNNLHPKLRSEAMQIITAAETKFPKNIAIRAVQGFRTWEEQNALYAQGRTTPGQIVTNARAGSSYHNFGLAIDFAILYDKDGNGAYEELSWNTLKDMDKDGLPDWSEVVASFEAAGWEWGGRWRTFKDLPHVQKTFGYSVAQLRELYVLNKFIPGTKYVLI